MIEQTPDIPPAVTGFIMAVFTAIIRVIYDRQETSVIRIFLEALLCGALTLTAGSAIDALGYNQNWTLFAGGMIGLIGSQSIKILANKFVTNKLK